MFTIYPGYSAATAIEHDNTARMQKFLLYCTVFYCIVLFFILLCTELVFVGAFTRVWVGDDFAHNNCGPVAFCPLFSFLDVPVFALFS